LIKRAPSAVHCAGVRVRNFWVLIPASKGDDRVDVHDLSQWQFGVTTVHHSLFVPITIGLGLGFLVAFFHESAFLGRWVFGWERLSPRLHVAAL
jgi:cytochrome bd-type quinol oxidase subunit 1